MLTGSGDMKCEVFIMVMLIWVGCQSYGIQVRISCVDRERCISCSNGIGLVLNIFIPKEGIIGSDWTSKDACEAS